VRKGRKSFRIYFIVRLRTRKRIGIADNEILPLRLSHESGTKTGQRHQTYFPVYSRLAACGLPVLLFPRGNKKGNLSIPFFGGPSAIRNKPAS
jgi:hypothetical protein